MSAEAKALLFAHLSGIKVTRPPILLPVATTTEPTEFELTIFAELRRINERLDALAAAPDIILTREQAAKQLKVSVRQLQRLVAARRLIAMPSGIARAELERYAKTPQTPLPKAVSKPTRVRTAAEEARRLREMLKTRRGRK